MSLKVLDILVVDDQPGVRYLLDIIIKELGHRVHTAQNGLEALEKVCSIQPDLVFMDVRMPVMGGLEALARLKIQSPQTKVIIMSAYGSGDIINEARKLGATACLAKPFDVEEIKEFLQKYILKHYTDQHIYKASVI